MTGSSRCPCGSGDTYADCCQRFHSGDLAAPTAQALMRSRFSAFAVRDVPYLLATWHPSTRPALLDLDEFIVWTRLDVVEVKGGGPFDSAGIVEFRAHHRVSGSANVLHERSSFRRVDGRWRYLSGDVLPGRI